MTIDDLDVEDAVTSLVDRSMLTTVTGVGSTRFRLLETLRAWGEDWLFTNSDPEPFRNLHSDFYCELMKRCGTMFWTPRERDAWDALRESVAPLVRAPDRSSDCLARAGAACRARDIGCSKDRLLAAFVHAYQMRDRFTILDLALMVGVMPGSAAEIVETWA